MKMTKFYITLLCAALALPIFADTFKERTDNWLQPDNNTRTDNWLQTETWLQPATADRPGIGVGVENEKSTNTPYVTPIGDGLPVLLAFGVAYGFFAFRRTRKAIVKE